MDNELEALRRAVDEQDEVIVSALCRRREITNAIGQYKQQHGLPVFVPERELEVLQKVSALAGGAAAAEIKELYRLLMEQSRKRQEESNG